jgi:hypothetical protein
MKNVSDFKLKYRKGGIENGVYSFAYSYRV